jgi:hypothetical protein
VVELDQVRALVGVPLALLQLLDELQLPVDQTRAAPRQVGEHAVDAGLQGGLVGGQPHGLPVHDVERAGHLPHLVPAAQWHRLDGDVPGGPGPHRAHLLRQALVGDVERGRPQQAQRAGQRPRHEHDDRGGEQQAEQEDPRVEPGQADRAALRGRAGVRERGRDLPLRVEHDVARPVARRVPLRGRHGDGTVRRPEEDGGPDRPALGVRVRGDEVDRFHALREGDLVADVGGDEGAVGGRGRVPVVRGDRLGDQRHPDDGVLELDRLRGGADRDERVGQPGGRRLPRLLHLLHHRPVEPVRAVDDEGVALQHLPGQQQRRAGHAGADGGELREPAVGLLQRRPGRRVDDVVDPGDAGPRPRDGRVRPTDRLVQRLRIPVAAAGDEERRAVPLVAQGGGRVRDLLADLQQPVRRPEIRGRPHLVADPEHTQRDDEEGRQDPDRQQLPGQRPVGRVVAL